ncbi:MAG TPA: glycosyltransferase family 87 protein, partial [Chloroflexota bacterium]
MPSIDRVIRIAVPLACLQLLFAAAVLGSHGAPGALGGDFIAYYSAGKQLLAGDGAHLYNLASQLPYQQRLLQSSGLTANRPTMIPFDYPPPAALIFLPLALLPPRVAVLLWLAVNTAAALLAWRRLFGQRSRVGPLALFLLFPLDWGLLSGQPVGLLLLLATLSFQSLTAGQDAPAGVWLGLLAVFKPQLVVIPLLGLLVLRRPRAVLGAAAAGLAVLVLSLVLVGLPGLVAYLGLLRQIDPALGNTAYSVRTGAMVNWRAWITAIPGITGTTALELTAAAALLTLVVALFPCVRRHGRPEFALLYLGLTAAGIVA